MDIDEYDEWLDDDEWRLVEQDAHQLEAHHAGRAQCAESRGVLAFEYVEAPVKVRWVLEEVTREQRLKVVGFVDAVHEVVGRDVEVIVRELDAVWRVDGIPIEYALHVRQLVQTHFANAYVYHAPDLMLRALCTRKVPDEPLTSSKNAALEQATEPSAKHPQTGMRHPSGLIPATMWEALFPFQQTAVEFGVACHGRMMLADDMGLGKTASALAIACCYKEGDWPLLIICPASLRENWKREVIKWYVAHGVISESECCFMLACASRRRKRESTKLVAGKKRVYSDLWGTYAAGEDEGPSPRLVVVGYESAVSLQEFLQASHFGTVIVDESHMLKNMDTVRVAFLGPIIKATRRQVMLSGTPALSRSEELFFQAHLVRPDLFPSRASFLERYMPGRPSERHVSDLERELGDVLRVFMMRRRKDSVNLSIPPKTRGTVQVQMTMCDKDDLQERWKKLDDIKQRLGVDMAKDRVSSRHQSSSTDRLLEQMLQVQRYMYFKTGMAKLSSVNHRCAQLLFDGTGRKLIVFAHHAKVMSGIWSYIKGLPGIHGIFINGQTSMAGRQRLVDEFQTQNETRVAVLSMGAAGVGFSLTRADHVLFAELSWNPAILLQAEDRACRIGRREPVSVEIFLAPGSFDDDMWPRVAHKLQTVTHVVDRIQHATLVVNTDASRIIDASQAEADCLDMHTITNISHANEG
ncbi:SWI/SNF-related matrix-associated actin-dependent regulator [Porphyridium purpureum]|uniref:SWI/SNF-related matrix-associated actin-dependent regulator n=1 Tax=Porphyridium purpureum TaxID=35688 RepID=A0A5J4YL05_PORPP|nr:SWI/SNF-related matrix-associated actin-dependent regulator [Porphyridium purpureum]|eukprot:POR1485..scf244_11